MTRQTIIESNDYADYFLFIANHINECKTCETNGKVHYGHFNNRFLRKKDSLSNIRNKLNYLTKGDKYREGLNFIHYKNYHYSINFDGIFEYISKKAYDDSNYYNDEENKILKLIFGNYLKNIYLKNKKPKIKITLKEIIEGFIFSYIYQVLLFYRDNNSFENWHKYATEYIIVNGLKKPTVLFALGNEIWRDYFKLN